MDQDLQNYIPKNKHDLEMAEAAVSLGYPAVAPILPELFEWLQDCNWPVAHVIAPFLVSIGKPIAPHIRLIFQTQDDIWKYWILIRIVRNSDELARELQPELKTFAALKAQNEDQEDIIKIAQEILIKISCE